MAAPAAELGLTEVKLGIIVENAPIAVATAKHAIDEGVSLELDEALALELRHYEKVLATEDRLEGLKAFAEKRKPAYKGR